ncbi:MAG: cysteine hydrolase [Alphaproteobacteria bacterium]|nr:cysteine hydrolase [Alphaproteobacteria bacterium]
MPKALLIIDVQKSAISKPELVKKVENLQYEYDTVYVAKFNNTNSPLLKFLDWNGFENPELAFTPKDGAIVYDKIIFSAFLPEMKKFDEIHICGFDTDAGVYKTAMDLIENNIRPIILKDYCYSETQELHNMAMELLKRNIGIKNIK